MVWTAPKTWAVNDILTAADLNTYTRDNELALGTWTTYVPTWTGTTTNPAVGNGTIAGRYLATSDWCDVWIGLLAGSSTTYGSGTYALSLPFAAVTGWESFINAQLLDTTVSRYPGYGLILSGSSSVVPFQTGWASTWAPTVPFTFGNGDSITLFGKYRRV